MCLEGGGEYRAAQPLLERAIGAWAHIVLPEIDDPTQMFALVSWSDHGYRDSLFTARARALWLDMFGPGRPHAVLEISNGGYLLSGGRSYGMWSSLLAEMLPVAERALGPHHPHLAYVRTMLANN